MFIRALEFYCGIGGLHLALDRSNVDGGVVGAFDWDQTACQVYQANHPQIDSVIKTDISLLTASYLSSFRANLWLLSPACQPYTVLNPFAKGAADPRAQSFLHLVQNVLPELASTSTHPQHLLVENVAGFETSSTRQILLSVLRALGYATFEFLLTPLQFGIPNSRLRYYLLAKASPLSFRSTQIENQIWRSIPGHSRDWVDPRLQQTTDASDSVKEIRDYLYDNQENGTAIPDRVLEKWGRLFDIVLPNSQRTCCFTQGYTQLVERTGSIIQMNEQLDTTKTFDDFLKARSEGDVDAVRLLHPLKLRYFSPAELLRLFHFTGDDGHFVWPEGVSTKKKYKLIGNSVNVKVVTELIIFLFE